MPSMDRNTLQALLESVRRGDTTVLDALGALRDFPVAELEEASIDTHRGMRRGFPVVVLGWAIFFFDLILKKNNENLELQEKLKNEDRL